MLLMQFGVHFLNLDIRGAGMLGRIANPAELERKHVGRILLLGATFFQPVKWKENLRVPALACFCQPGSNGALPEHPKHEPKNSSSPNEHHGPKVDLLSINTEDQQPQL
ncbi:uncharacterized protein PV09_08412 [Verruconis gallopava]|uniref:Uncharacterized protein n=1 Tax=Verruconis gallopava TaxID=253628 RepID=A0A0D2ALT5_9PEZI|nr:uncharacterized protein PV09_08412 [Verruconis gallopava]KIW00069.1 hypothetical protein PV09_08412 [Verruconis gallopava]